MRAAAIVAAVGLVLAAAARAELPRGTLKIDVRSPDGEVQEAPVTVRPRAGGEARQVARAGQVYVAEGLVDGEWVVEVAGAAPQVVRVAGRQLLGVVAVLGEARRGGRRPDRASRASRSFTVGEDEPACDDEAGALVEAIAFQREQLAAGRLEVRNGGRGKAGQRLLCAATLAGGGATLRLVPGDYVVSARLVGGGRAQTSYHVAEGRPAPPLVLRSR